MSTMINNGSAGPAAADGENSEVLIRVENLVKSFGDHVVLNGISQEIRRGEKVVIIGPSGSGKSTFLRCLNLLEEPTSGKIYFGGIDLTDKNTDINAVRRKMGMVFQHFNLFPNMTVQRNITLAPVRTGFMKQEEADEKAIELLKRVDLLDKADAYPSSLSGGQKQRIAIVRAMAMNPDMMLFDEPTSARNGLCKRGRHPRPFRRRRNCQGREHSGRILLSSSEPQTPGLPVQGALKIRYLQSRHQGFEPGKIPVK